ncbi:MAG: T9SS type A sorting domain-containing protein, partial [Flavobacteriales bacterium]|nr:T9SS type A sorting domain-containing protein [Flavobacteriales bacterium]
NSTVQLVDAQGRVIAATNWGTAQSGWYVGDVAAGCYVVRVLDGTRILHASKWSRT